MANTLKQTVTQYNIDNIPTRILVQYENESGEELQEIVDYSSLTTEEKAVFDAFKSLSESKIV